MNQPDFAGAACPTPHRPKETVLLGHGSGGTLSRELVEQVFLPELGEAAPQTLDDAAIIAIQSQGQDQLQGQRLALSTDSHVVEPLFFPGGDIGHLAVCGTVNDLAMVGAKPLALTCGFILEEGLPFATLRQVLASMRLAAKEAGIHFAAGDTKVVQRGSADKMFINTSGVGMVDQGVQISGANARPGDVIIVSGTLGDHGITVLATREDLGFDTDLISDAAPLNHLVQAMLAAGEIHTLRDPTRGGLATSLVEISEQSQVTLLIEEDKLPVKPAVRAACEMLGFDPLFIANEGKLVAFVPPEDAEAVLATMHQTKYGEDATIIGRVLDAGKAEVRLETAIGGTRLLDMLPGELLPRIC
ncbi:MAG: hydrogenase expression/formation protein HypE [Candidatus Electrothrix sp. Rat3]|nr:hydrogenase expression/formation protein HypE [Candidatus Electrothrix rattekaaiensis]